MSGGHFDYNQYKIHDTIEMLFELIREQKMPFDKDVELYSKKTLKEFEKGLEYLKKAHIYTQRIDWLVSCDDGEGTFHERLKEDLDNLIK